MEIGQHIEGAVLCSFHDFTLARPFVIDSAKVKDTMNDHPVQLCFVSGTELFSIGAYGVETDEKITGNPIAFTIVERNDIRVIIVLQILAGLFIV